MEEIARLRKWLWREHALSLVVIGCAVVALSTGWRLFSGRLVERGERSRLAADDVARIWGGPLLQPQPEVRWRRADAATVELEPGELSSTTVDVELDVEYRRRGVVEYPGYDAKLAAQYAFVNPSPEASFVAFSVGLPADRAALMLRDVRLTIDGREDPAHTEYAQDRIVWRGRVDGARAAKFALAYRARGLGRFGYRFVEKDKEGAASARPVTGFKLALRARNLRGEVDFPVGSMAPTSVSEADGARLFAWEVDRLLTSFDVGVVLPDRRDLESALGRLIGNAPWFYLLFASALLFALDGISRRARALHLAGLSFAYFLYFPLAAYLSAYLPWPIAASLALAGIASLVLLHVDRSIGASATVRTGLALFFYLATPAVAYLLPAHTGLILVVAGFLALGVGLHYLGKLARRIPDDEPEAQPCAQP